MRLRAEEARAWQLAATPFVLLFVVGIPLAFATILRWDPDPNPNPNPNSNPNPNPNFNPNPHPNPSTGTGVTGTGVCGVRNRRRR